MAQNLTFEYDAIGDILYIRKVAPYAQQRSEQLEFNVVARYNPKTRELEGLEILFFTRWFLKSGVARNLPELFSQSLAA